MAKVVREGGGTISFEWPRYSLGWARQEVLDFVASFSLTSVPIDGCAFGLSHGDKLIKKPWRIVTDHPILADNHKPWRCNGEHEHLPISGSITPKSAYYNRLMCQVISKAIFPHKMSSHIPALACVPVS